MNTTAPPDPFFIVGADRSGTSLLAVMLRRHPMVAIPPESHFILRLWARRRRYGSGGRVDRPEAFVRDLAAEPRFKNWGIGVEPIRKRLETDRAVTLPQAIDMSFLSYAWSKGRLGWGDKTPRQVRRLHLLARLFPNARFVHVVRDGRDVALSMIDLKHFHRSAATAAFFWRRAVGSGTRAGRALGTGRYVEIRYEELVNDPRASLEQLLAFLGLPFDPAVLSAGGPQVPARAPGKWSENRRPWLAYQRPTKGLRDWRRQMSRPEVAEFEAVAGTALASLGYERVIGRPTVMRWLRAWLRVAWFPIRTLGPRARMALRGRARRLKSTRGDPYMAPTEEQMTSRLGQGGF